jgi:hypothetical protein
VVEANQAVAERHRDSLKALFRDPAEQAAKVDFVQRRDGEIGRDGDVPERGIENDGELCLQQRGAHFRGGGEADQHDDPRPGGLRTDSHDSAIVGCMITLGKLLGLSIIAEGIEDADTAELLARMGCAEGQGYYFGPPMPAAEFEQRFLLANVSDFARVIKPATTAA